MLDTGNFFPIYEMKIFTLVMTDIFGTTEFNLKFSDRLDYIEMLYMLTPLVQGFNYWEIQVYTILYRIDYQFFLLENYFRVS